MKSVDLLEQVRGRILKETPGYALSYFDSVSPSKGGRETARGLISESKRRQSVSWDRREQSCVRGITSSKTRASASLSLPCLFSYLPSRSLFRRIKSPIKSGLRWRERDSSCVRDRVFGMYSELHRKYAERLSVTSLRDRQTRIIACERFREETARFSIAAVFLEANGISQDAIWVFD